jgi:hypothetical protein
VDDQTLAGLACKAAALADRVLPAAYAFASAYLFAYTVAAARAVAAPKE